MRTILVVALCAWATVAAAQSSWCGGAGCRLPQPTSTDPEFYDRLSRFVDGLIKGLPTSNDAAIEAMERKAKELRGQRY